MAITTKTAAALMAIFIALLLGAGVILRGSVQPQFDHLETDLHAADRARVESNLRALNQDLVARVLDYARWDDSYAYFRGRKPSFPSENFYADWFSDYGLDAVLLLDDHGRVLWSGAPDGDHLGAPNEDLTRALIRQARRTLPAETGHGFVFFHGESYSFATARSTGSDGNATPHGQVLFARRLAVNALAEQTQLNLVPVDIDRPGPLAGRYMDALTHAASVTWRTERSLYSLMPLRQADGALAGALLAQRPRDLTALGGRTVLTALALFAAISALAVLALWAVLHVTVIGRLQKLQRHFETQTNAIAPAAQTEQASRDEIGRLTAAYNNLVWRAQEASEKARAAASERDQAAAANAMKSNFLTNISHRLRTPLDSVIGYTELIDEDLADHGLDGPRKDLALVTASARQLLSLINEILDLSRIEAGRMELSPETFRVEEMLLDALSETPRPDLVDAVIDRGIGGAYSDQKRLRQAVVNVLAHASRFALDGRVSLRARRITEANGRDKLRFEIRHRGALISPEDLERAFEPFAPSGSATAHSAGLNLAITRQLVALLHGELDASALIGGGAAFVIKVPALLEEAPAADRDDVQDAA